MPTAEDTEKRPPTQSQKPNAFCGGITREGRHNTSARFGRAHGGGCQPSHPQAGSSAGCPEWQPATGSRWAVLADLVAQAHLRVNAKLLHRLQVGAAINRPGGVHSVTEWL